MGFELLEGVLDGEDVLAVVVLLVDLVVETVVDAALDDVGVVLLVELVGGSRVE